MRASAALDLVAETQSRIDGLAGAVDHANRIAGEALGRAGSRLTDARVEEIAWNKAGDRLFLWKEQSARYEDKWFYDQLWERGLKQLRHFGLLAQNALAQLHGTPPEDKDESS